MRDILDTKVIIVLNDNTMSISENVGGMSKFLKNVRLNTSYNACKSGYKVVLNKSKTGKKLYKFTHDVKEHFKNKINHNLFTNLNIDYLGPINGHDINEVINALKKAKSSKKSILVHVHTIKGKGYKPAEEDSSKWHGVGSFDIETGSYNLKVPSSLTL